MEHLPGPAPPGAVLLLQPPAGPAEAQTGAVHQQVHGLAPAPWPRHLQRLGPAAEGGVVGHGEVEPEQPQDGGDQPLGLAQRQAEHRAQGQGRGHRRIGVARLPATTGARLGLPGRDRLGREPHGQAATGAQTGIVLGPVRDPLLLLGDVMAPSGIRFERQEGCPCMVEGPRPGFILPDAAPSGRSMQQGALPWQKSRT